MKAFLGKCCSVVAVFLALLLSRTLWICASALYVIWKIHWTDVQTLYSFKEQWQAQAFTQLAMCRYGIISSIVGIYCGFTKGSTGIAGFVSQTFSRSTTVTEPIQRTQSTKNLD